jgi:hypothetical protein
VTTPDPAAAAEAATEVVQAAAKPIGFIAALFAGALGVAFLVRRFGQSLPLPAYLADLVDDEDQGDEDDEE